MRLLSSSLRSTSLLTLKRLLVSSYDRRHVLSDTYLVEAEATIRNAIEYVKNQQKTVLDALEKTEKTVQVIAPAFQWAQSLDNVYLNIKYATRFDTPGCLETYNENITIEERRVNISIYCKHVWLL